MGCNNKFKEGSLQINEVCPSWTETKKKTDISVSNVICAATHIPVNLQLTTLCGNHY